MTPQTVSRLRPRTGAVGFVHGWEITVEKDRIRSQNEALRGGLDGWLPIVRNGTIVGHRRRFGNRLLFAPCYGEPASQCPRLYEPD